MTTFAIWALVLVLINIGFWLARFLAPVKKMVTLNETILQEHQRCKLELAKAAEEISLIRKHLENSV
ncbi:hypothetical protein CXF85_21150 [Colwellia sp. 75C3]|uniref:hypothetical protein n=1 Tax=Colwellia sp. 75C3 TaxID=888425 RepID=UPI000C31BC63|nr:hypothetical protein [Colwellia sp. 75C3]PKG80634.1 hypothetical protein CXF85_21150 [Colwellia sp. 75C3]